MYIISTTSRKPEDDRIFFFYNAIAPHIFFRINFMLCNILTNFCKRLLIFVLYRYRTVDNTEFYKFHIEKHNGHKHYKINNYPFNHVYFPWGENELL